MTMAAVMGMSVMFITCVSSESSRTTIHYYD